MEPWLLKFCVKIYVNYKTFSWLADSLARKSVLINMDFKRDFAI